MQFSTLEDQSRMKTSGSTASNTGIPSEPTRSEEHTSELQSQSNLVCRLLLEKKKQYNFYLRICLMLTEIFVPVALVKLVKQNGLDLVHIVVSSSLTKTASIIHMTLISRQSLT